MIAEHAFVEIPIERIASGDIIVVIGQTDRPAPGVCSPVCNPVGHPFGYLHLHRMVSRIAEVPVHSDLSKLRVEGDVVFREKAAVANESAAFIRDVRAGVEEIRQTANAAVRQESARIRVEP